MHKLQPHICIVNEPDADNLKKNTYSGFSLIMSADDKRADRKMRSERINEFKNKIKDLKRSKNNDPAANLEIKAALKNIRRTKIGNIFLII